MFKNAVQRGRSERGGEAYFLLYVEPPSDARTKLAAFFNILLEPDLHPQPPLIRRRVRRHPTGLLLCDPEGSPY